MIRSRELLRTLAATAAALACSASLATAQVRALTLPEMVNESDQAVYGEITSKRVQKIVAEDGRELFFTTLTVEGRLMHDATPITVEVAFPGGFIGDEGYWHSESPSADETRVGTRIVAFYKWFAGMGEAHSANWLYANHGGLYRTVDGPRGTMVLGRGESYAVSKNLALDDLEASVTKLRAERARRQGR